MHADDRPVGIDSARALVAAQFPLWAGLPLRPIAGTEAGGGTDNVIYRLGRTRALRFPRTESAAALPEKEWRWLPALAPRLPLPLPVPQALGAPGAGHPWAWTVARWLPGRDAQAVPPDQMQAARDLAGFIAALHALPLPAGAPPMSDWGRLPPRDPFIRRMIAAFRPDEGDAARLSALWDACLALPPWTGPPVWVHADLHPLNILSDGRRLSGVIDWGGLCAGDPAHDLAAAWYLFDSPARALFRDLLRPRPADWARARALALSKALQAIPYYRRTNAPFRAAMRATLARVLADAGALGGPG